METYGNITIHLNQDPRLLSIIEGIVSGSSFMGKDNSKNQDTFAKAKAGETESPQAGSDGRGKSSRFGSNSREEIESLKTVSEETTGLEKKQQEEIETTKNMRLEAAKNMIDNISAIGETYAQKSRAWFGIHKAASLAQATINTYEGITKAISAYPPPWNFAAAAVTAAAGFEQVSKIASTSFGSSGDRSAPQGGGRKFGPDKAAESGSASASSSSSDSKQTQQVSYIFNIGSKTIELSDNSKLARVIRESIIPLINETTSDMV